MGGGGGGGYNSIVLANLGLALGHHLPTVNPATLGTSQSVLIRGSYVLFSVGGTCTYKRCVFFFEVATRMAAFQGSRLKRVHCIPLHRWSGFTGQAREGP